MKSYVSIVLLMLFVYSNGFSMDKSLNKESERKISESIVEDQSLSEQFEGLEDVNLGEITEIINSDYSCTRSIKVYVPTTAGLIGFGLSITADTCEEANSGLADAVRGFVNEVM
ncbi:hypothetical protein [Christiangramia echinicola]|uniref:Uncharacterized protein n=1 Tax=Christiangramia echinicola TaxID=279359 RepID=A0A1H1LDE7_9FLAO|nr:hypothetical protein [Christiangramia echinicola]SDR72447.1 hypothetical protein SAMN04488552_0719 [Christiangramia echinicola]